MLRNRAKCKLCDSIIESFHDTDHVICKCGEIEVNGGQAMFAKANDFANFLRVDDLGNEIVVQYIRPNPSQESGDAVQDEPKEITRDEMLKLLEAMIDDDEKLPAHAKTSPINIYDLLRYMLLISKILKKGDVVNGKKKRQRRGPRIGIDPPPETIV